MKGTSMIGIRYSGRTFAAKKTPSGKIMVLANNGAHVAIKDDELSAYLWLGDHGLRRGRIRGLLNAVMRNEGPFANPQHPKRVENQ